MNAPIRLSDLQAENARLKIMLEAKSAPVVVPAVVEPHKFGGGNPLTKKNARVVNPAKAEPIGFAPAPVVVQGESVPTGHKKLGDNLTGEVVGTTLILRIDLRGNLGPSVSGKSMLVSSSRGIKKIGGIKVGVNAFKTEDSE